MTPTTLILLGAILALNPVDASAEAYVWNRVLPPVMKQHPDIVSMGHDQLCRPVRAPTQQTSDTEVRTSDQVLAWKRTVVVLASSHEECWRRVSPPNWSAVDRKEVFVTSEAVEESTRNTVQETLSAELALGSDSTPASAKMKAEVQRSRETMTSLKAHKETTVEISYPKDVWFTLWALVETITVARTTTEIITLGTQRQEMSKTGPTTVTASVQELKSVFHDKASDADMRKMNPKEYRK